MKPQRLKYISEKPLSIFSKWKHMQIITCFLSSVLLDKRFCLAWLLLYEETKNRLDSEKNLSLFCQKMQHFKISHQSSSLPSFLAFHSSTKQAANSLQNKGPQREGPRSPSIPILWRTSSQQRPLFSPHDPSPCHLVWLCMPPYCAKLCS